MTDTKDTENLSEVLVVKNVQQKLIADSIHFNECIGIRYKILNDEEIAEFDIESHVHRRN